MRPGQLDRVEKLKFDKSIFRIIPYDHIILRKILFFFNFIKGVTHATFVAAADANRIDLAASLLKAGVCDPDCRAVQPVELRPLHIVSAYLLYIKYT